jgi:hypothetical protein
MPATIKSTTFVEVGGANWFVTLTLADGKGGTDTKNALELRMAIAHANQVPTIRELQIHAIEHAVYHLQEELKRLESLPWPLAR